MRLWILIALVGCTPPPQRPSLVADSGGVQGCKSRPTELGGVRYECTGYEIIDSIGPLLSIATIRDQLKARGRTLDAEVIAGPHDVAGVDDAILVEYSKRGKHAVDVVAVQPVEAKTRVVQCHVDWFDGGKVGRIASCDRAIGIVMARAAPPGRELSAECGRAIAHLAKLPGHPEDSEELRAVQRSTAARCNDALAACIAASTTYVEASVCTP